MVGWHAHARVQDDDDVDVKNVEEVLAVPFLAGPFEVFGSAESAESAVADGPVWRTAVDWSRRRLGSVGYGVYLEIYYRPE